MAGLGVAVGGTGVAVGGTGVAVGGAWVGVTVGVAVAVAVGVIVERRQERVRSILGLAAPRPTRARLAAAAAAGACVAFGVAAAQPVLTGEATRRLRTTSEVVFVVDVSRSMLASQAAGAPTRLEQARETIRSLRLAVPDVPAGVSGLTDRVLPYLFPSPDLAAFEATVDRSVLPESPPPDRTATVATSYAGLGALVSDGFFSRGIRARTCVLVTDGETRPDGESFDAGSPVVIVGSAGGGEADPAAGAAAPSGNRLSPLQPTDIVSWTVVPSGRPGPRRGARTGCGRGSGGSRGGWGCWPAWRQAAAWRRRGRRAPSCSRARPPAGCR